LYVLDFGTEDVQYKVRNIHSGCVRSFNVQSVSLLRFETERLMNLVCG